VIEVDIQDFDRGVQKLLRKVTNPKLIEPVLDLLEAKSVELAPLDTGNLEASTAREVVSNEHGLQAQFGFTAPYAAEVHEMPMERRGPGTRAKPGNEFGPAGPGYLIRPLRGLSKQFVALLREALEKTVKS
jgi:hypothetical protein